MKINEGHKSERLYLFFLLHLLLAFLSLGSVFGKLAANQGGINSKFIMFYFFQLFVLFIYAIFWQQFIKRMSLSTAYANRAITVLWGMVWGVFLFNEPITTNKVIGCMLIVVGILLFLRGNKDD